MVAIFAAILHHSHPRFARFEVFPHVFKRFRRHIGVTNHVMWLVYELIKRVTGDITKLFTGVFDMTAESGGRKKIEVRWIGDFLLSNRLVIAHKRAPFNSSCCAKCCAL
ncbi:Uncharacterised protein [Vibrio cholerae]|uniref:Uncharacterized protein n=1 Tax=Vibrio cholerae TaxID=666 RepID=A0A655NXG8_VIBCL|nr:Uncharacterised protein [Vibrio cholerae]CSA29379.1 Uncharacterised protein [Vibrio cholerae]CSC28581.1 Uncharacterised protein [Vibrio cholerae]CSD68297.1 Uncharacterised protein [Vibrio cholerae]